MLPWVLDQIFFMQQKIHGANRLIKCRILSDVVNNGFHIIFLAARCENVFSGGKRNDVTKMEQTALYILQITIHNMNYIIGAKKNEIEMFVLSKKYQQLKCQKSLKHVFARHD